MVKRVAESAPTVQIGKRRSVESPHSDSETQSDDTVFDASCLATATSGAPPEDGAPAAAARRSASEAGLGGVHAVFADQGARAYQEDAHSVHVTAATAAYGVFDGHGSPFVAEYCARHLLPRACGAAEAAAAARGAGAGEDEAAGPALREAFCNLDGELARAHARDAHMCGSTAAVALLTRGWVHTANCGGWPRDACTFEGGGERRT